MTIDIDSRTSREVHTFFEPIRFQGGIAPRKPETQRMQDDLDTHGFGIVLLTPVLSGRLLTPLRKWMGVSRSELAI
jgi:hypothetical protein